MPTMCECLRGIFRVTWTPSSDADSDQEDSHVFNPTRDSAVRDKRRSPPSHRSPSGTQRNTYQSCSTDEQDSPERAVQKEKLHAELKQVLSQKRSHLKESSCQLAQPEMDSEPTDDQTSVEEASKAVEIYVETEAEAGASGYSVTGGGQQGIFVKDVLKDSPAAKHLSLQQGDQLLSAKVYFDNVKYEDALKILQCAEPYKVSFQLKRTLAGAETTVRPRVPSVEVKGPKAKMAKMSVKGIKPFKAKKKRGGRFGLKRLKEKRKEELVIEGTPPRLEMSDMDVEFSLPKFKQSRSAKENAGTAVIGKTGRRIRFPHIKAKAHSGTEPGVKGKTTQMEIPGTNVKTKGKVHKFGINFSKSKHTKTGLVELKASEVNIQPPVLEFSLPEGKCGTVNDKSATELNAPDVEFALPSEKSEGSLPADKGKVITKTPKIKGEFDAEISGRKVDGGKGDTKLRMPKLKLPKVRLSRHSDELQGGVKVKGDMKIPHAGIKPPEVNIKEGQLEMKSDISAKSPQVQELSDVSLPNLKGKTDVEISLPQIERAGTIKMPACSITVPDVDLEMDTGQRVPDEVEGTFKGPKIRMPQFDMSLPKMGLSDVDTQDPEEEGKFALPSVDICLPEVKTETVDVIMDCYVGGDGKFKMPDFDLILPKIKTPEGEVKGQEEEGGVTLPKVDMTLQKVTGESDLSLPKMKTGRAEFEMPKEVKGEAELKMPNIDVSLPKLTQTKSNIKITGHQLEESVDLSLPTKNLEGNFSPPSVDISMPKMKLPEPTVTKNSPKLSDIDYSLPMANIDLKGGHSKEKLKMPEFDVTLPKAEGEVEGPEVQGGGKSFDISFSAMNTTEGEVKTDNPEGKFHMPSLDVSLPKFKFGRRDIKHPDIKINTNAQGIQDGETKKPTIDISLPEGGLRGDVDFEGNPDVEFNLPSVDISLPKGKFPEANDQFQGPKVKGGGDFEIPKIDFSLSKEKSQGGFELDIEGCISATKKTKMPKVDISSPTVNLLQGDVKIKGSEIKGPSDINISLPTEKAERDTDVESRPGKTGRFHMPYVDISLPKIKAKTPKVSPEVDMPGTDLSLLGGKLETGACLESPKNKVSGELNMPFLNVSQPTFQSLEVNTNLDVKGPKDCTPTVNIDLPKGKIGCDKDVKEFEVKFTMPTSDMSLPNVTVPKADFSVDKALLEGSLPKTKMDTDGKEGQFHIFPKITAKVPQVNTEGFEVEGGKNNMPDIDIASPKGTADTDVSFGIIKEGAFKMPKVDVSLPKVKLPESSSKVNPPDIKGGNTLMEPSGFFVQGGKAEADITVKGQSGKENQDVPKVELISKKGKLSMPTIEINVPKFDLDLSLPSGEKRDINVFGQSSDASVDVDMSTPKGEVKPSGADIGQGGIEGPGAAIKLPTFKLPTVDISAPKVDLDFGHSKQGDDVEIELLKAEGSRPSSGGSYDPPNLKVPIFSLPRFTGKSKSGDFTILAPKGNISPCPPHIVGEIGAPSEEADGEGKVKGKKTKIKMPSFGISKRNADVSVSCPDLDTKVKNDVPKQACNVEIPDKESKYKLKFPKFNLSSPKREQPEREVDAKLKANVEGKGGFHAPDVHIKLPKFSMAGFGSKDKDLGNLSGNLEGKPSVKMPSVELSLPTDNTPDTEVLLPKTEVDVSQADIQGYEGNLRIPKLPIIDVSIPKIDLDVSLPKGKDEEVNIGGPGGGKFKMPDLKLPDVDITLPKGKVEGPKVEIEGKRGKFKMPHPSIHSVDISFPKVKVERPEVAKLPDVDILMPKGQVKNQEEELKGKVGKFNMPSKFPSVDVSIPKGPEFNIERPKAEEFKMEDVKMVDVGLSLPKGKGIEVDLEGGKFKMPSVDISLPKSNTEGSEVDTEGIEVDIEGRGKFKRPDIKMPTIDLSLSQYKIKAPNVNIEGSENGKIIKEPKKGKFKIPHLKMPDVDISLPKGKVEDPEVSSSTIEGSEVKIERPEAEIKQPTGGSFKMPNLKMPDIDISLPRVKAESPEVEIEQKGSGFKMPHYNYPSVDISLPEGKIGGPEVNIKGPEGKLKMSDLNIPDIDISLPKRKVEGPCVDIKGEGEKFKMSDLSPPSFNIVLPKGSSEGPESDIEGPKGGKFQMPHIEMPNIDISLPKGKAVDPEVDIEGKIEGPEVDFKGKGEKFNLQGPDCPLVAISLPKGKIKSPEVNIEGPKGRIFHMPDVKMPTVNISLPKGKVKGPEVDIDGSKEKTFEVPDAKLPDADICFPKGKIEGPEVEIEGKGGKFKMPLPTFPSVHISLPKAKLESPEVDVEASEGGILKMPSVDISLPKGNVSSEIGIEVPEGVNFKMPTVDITLPKEKTGGTQFDIEKPELHKEGPKAGRFKMPHFKMPDIDLSLPKGKIENAKVNFDPPESGKFKLPEVKMPDVNISLNKGPEDYMQEPKGEIFKMPDIKMSNIEISLPKGKVESPEVDTHAVDITLSKGNIEGPKGGKFKIPHLKGPEVETKGKGGNSKMPHLDLPSVDISLPKGKIKGPEVDMEGHESGKLKMSHVKMPNIDITLPKGKIEGPDVNIKRPDADIEGPTGGRIKMHHIKMPDIDISLPKGKSESPEVEKGKGRGFKMPHLNLPSVDISLPKGKIDSPEVNIKGPEGIFKMSDVKMPEIDLSLPKRKVEGSKVETEGEGGKFEIPHLSLPSVDILPPKRTIEGPEVDIEGPKQRKFKMPNIKVPSIDISLPKGKDEGSEVDMKGKISGPEIDFEGKGGRFILPHPNLPSVDISLSKEKNESPEVDTDKGGKFKMPDVKMPSVNISLPKEKVKIPEVDIEGPETGKFKMQHIKMPNIDISLPKVKVKGSEFDKEGSTKEKLKMPDLKMPDVGTSFPKQKIEGPEVEIEGKDGRFKMRHPTPPMVDISLPKGIIENPELDIEASEKQKLKWPNVKMPSVDITLSKETTQGPEFPEVYTEGPKAGRFKVPQFKMPDVDIFLPKVKFEGPQVELSGKGEKLKMPHPTLPSTDFSFPKAKIEGPDVDIEGPEVKSKIPEGEMPDIDLLLLKGKVEGPEVETEGEGGKFKLLHVSLPSADISHPKGRIEGPEADIEGSKGGKFKMSNIKIPNINISLPKGKVESPEVEIEGKGGERPTFPSFDSTLPKGKTEGQVHIEGPKGGKFKISMPDVDISLPKGKIEGPEVETEGKAEKSKMPHPDLPSADISLPKGKIEIPNVQINLPKGGKFKMPDVKMPTVDIYVPKGHIKSPEVNIERHESGKLKMPTVDKSLPKGKIEGLEVNIEGPETDLEGTTGRKFKMPHIKMPSIGISLPKGKAEGPNVDIEGNVEGPEVEFESKGGKFNRPHPDLPSVDISLPKGKIKSPEVDIEGPKGGTFKIPDVKIPDVKMRNVNISLPLGKGPEVDIEAPEIGKFKRPDIKMPNIDIILPKGKVKGPEIHIEGSKEEKFKMPDVDISFPKQKTEQPEVEIEGKGGRFKMPHPAFPSVDISLPKGKLGAPEVDIEGCKRGKLKMPSVDISYPDKVISSAEVEEGLKAGQFKMPHFKMPDVDISVPKRKIEGPQVEYDGKGRDFKMPHPQLSSVDISFPKGKIEGSDIDIDVEVPKGKFKMPDVKMPNIDMSSHKGKIGGSEFDVEEPEVDIGLKVGKSKMPDTDIYLPKGKNKGSQFGAEGKGVKFKWPHPNLPSVDVSLSKEKIEGSDLNIQGPKGGKFKMPDVDISLPKGKSKEQGELNITRTVGEVKLPAVDISMPKETPDDLRVNVKGESGKFKMPTVDITGPKDFELDLVLWQDDKDKKQMNLPDSDMSTVEISSKEKKAKVKGTKFNIGMPKKKVSTDVTGASKQDITGPTISSHNSNTEGKGDINISVPEVMLPSVKNKPSSITVETELKGAVSTGDEIKVPRIPDIDFDIDTSHEDDDVQISKNKKIKIPKFGVPLPSLSSPEERLDVYGQEVQYEGPRMPKVKKAVFVLVNPNEPAYSSFKEMKADKLEAEEVKVKVPKIKMKPSFGKSQDHVTLEEKEKTKGGKMKMPKVSFPPGKTGSFEVTAMEEIPGISPIGESDSHKNEKGAISGKIKLPKVALTAPYGKTSSEREDFEVSCRLEKESSPESAEGDGQRLDVKPQKLHLAGFNKKQSKDVVSSCAKMKMTDKHHSESPSGLTMEISSAKDQTWTKVESKRTEDSSEERESSPWFKVPKFTLKPHSTGFLQITPEGSPQAQRKGEVGGELDVSGSFCFHSSGIDFSTEQMSEEVSTAEEGPVTMVTKTRITRQTVSTETRAGQSSAAAETCNIANSEKKSI